MTTYALHVELTLTRGALGRLIRAAEHRSVGIVELFVATVDGRLVVELAVEGKLPAEAFTAQLRKLYDVRDARLLGETPRPVPASRP